MFEILRSPTARETLLLSEALRSVTAKFQISLARVKGGKTGRGVYVVHWSRYTVTTLAIIDDSGHLAVTPAVTSRYKALHFSGV